jgi:hypothetical protein
MATVYDVFKHLDHSTYSTLTVAGNVDTNNLVQVFWTRYGSRTTVNTETLVLQKQFAPRTG